METLKVNVFDKYEKTEVLATNVSLSKAAAIKVAREESTYGKCDVHCYCWETGIDVTHIVNSYAPTEF